MHREKKKFKIQRLKKRCDFNLLQQLKNNKEIRFDQCQQDCYCFVSALCSSLSLLRPRDCVIPSLLQSLFCSLLFSTHTIPPTSLIRVPPSHGI